LTDGFLERAEPVRLCPVARFLVVSSLFDDAGPLRDAYRRVDWSATSLGSPESWSPTLVATLSLALNSPFPITLLWGADFVMLYNEAYVELIAHKHPDALGRSAAEVFPEIWDVVGPMLQSVREDAGPTLMQDLRLDLIRNKFSEECYFTFAYSAVRGVRGEIEGVIDICEETTSRILTRRRLETLRRVIQGLTEVSAFEDLQSRVDDALWDAPEDLRDVRIVRWAALPDQPADQDLTLTRAADTTIVQLRLAALSAAQVNLVMIGKLSPSLPIDDAYLTFVRLVGSAITDAVNRIQTRQIESQIVLLERQMSETLQLSLLTPPADDERVRIAVRYRPASERAHIGGDWYDSFVLPDKRLTIAIGDVTGHDRHAAAAMAQIRNLLRGIAFSVKSPPSTILTALESAMACYGPTTTATVLLAQFQPAGRPDRWTMRWSNAGHPPPALLTPEGTAGLLESEAEPLIGWVRPAARSDHTVEIGRGSSVVFYTDGLIERRDLRHSTSDEDLVHLLTGMQDLSADELCDHILARHSKGSFEDDVALTVVRLREHGETPEHSAET
jgi:serine phosphatase RsbU (regulator of sigma subunit)